ncbi:MULTISPECIES: glycoside hydrolase family 127 protein [Duncaniella]|uniref:Glycoside hydrolase family 127 protein n=5 Tax=Bacteroidales TaxID=171549 RepID=A0A4P7VZB6_9BACT|nr:MULTISPECIES: glycoside hydrolase family 127 protein [Duncaniella]MCX4283909.1 glycoside hydrolase family 127 protein [Duncaniella dubosii]QCD40914.1 glycoside hydrolase family 127 protein [Duncaniella dubosii]HBN63929.1 ATP-binding protein [Porphyromonadaceae bacterium]
MFHRFNAIVSCAAISLSAFAQGGGLTDMSESKHAVMVNTPIGSVKWTGGFWGERFDVYSGTSLQSMWETWANPDVSHGFRNFEIAAGTCEGEHWGPPFHDGDMYKWLEAVAAVYAVNKDPKLDALMDKFIKQVVKAQRADGYIHTPVIIDERNRGVDTHAHHKEQTVIGTKVGSADEKGAFANRLNFETYNLGHLMMAGIIHKRATGKTTLFDAAVKATDFLCNFYETASAELARNAICPSHYMGVVEMYRETGNPRYLDLANNLINIRGLVENGTDDNQDRIPFRDQYNAMGHAVRANYLYAGVADLYAETGEEQLMKNLTSIWNDIVNRKMYVTGACGALYDGTSPDGTCYEPDSIQKVHQSYGRPYQLPNSTAHNETCANIGNMLFNWRMLEATGDAKYADIVETALYNSVLSGVSLDGKRYFYTNPLRMSDDLPYTLRWPKTREEYISCFCCPPNTLRTICEAQNYAYTVNDSTLWFNLYGDSELRTSLGKKRPLVVTQHTGYPYDGKVVINLVEVPKKQKLALKLRVPSWCDNATVAVNGVKEDVKVTPDSYITLDRTWKPGDEVTFDMEMKTKLLESNPLVEETRNHTAVKRGPLVYCLEGIDIEGGNALDDILIPADAKFTTKDITIDGSHMTALETEARLVDGGDWTGKLYREVGSADEKVKVTLIPYFAWGNRDKSEMSVWLPLAR